MEGIQQGFMMVWVDRDAKPYDLWKSTPTPTLEGGTKS